VFILRAQALISPLYWNKKKVKPLPFAFLKFGDKMSLWPQIIETKKDAKGQKENY
jgi:hypothetical protein